MTTFDKLQSKYRLPKRAIAEEFECRWPFTMNYGDKLITCGSYYTGTGADYYGAVYSFTTEDHTCEGEIMLEEISEETFIDRGHALEWAIKEAAQHE